MDSDYPDWYEGENDTMDMADDLPPDQFWQADLVSGAEEDEDVDYYTFTIESGHDSIVDIGYLAEGTISDTSLELFDVAGNLLSSVVSYYGRNKVLSCGLAAGTYYLKLTPAGDVDQNSYYYIGYTLVEPLTQGQIELGLDQTTEISVNSLIDTAYLQFQLTETKSLDIVFAPTSLVSDYQVDLLGQDDNLIKRLTFGNGFSESMAVALKPGDYTLKMICTQDVDAGHTFSVSLLSSANHYEVEPNETCQTATELTQDVSLKGYLDDNLDFYAFSLEAPQYVKIDFTAETCGTDYNIILYKSDDSNPIDSTTCQKEPSAFIEVGLTAGNYYLKIESAGDKESNPSYIIALTESTNTQLEIESNNTMQFANMFDSLRPRQGRIYSLIDTDYYGFYVPDVVLVEIDFTPGNSAADYRISIINAEGTNKYSKVSVDGGAVNLSKLLSPGNYYVRVEPDANADPHAFYCLSTTTASLAGLKSLAGIILSAQTDQVGIDATLQINAMGNYSDATQGPIS
ncbi:hypothetical protein KA005_28865, partial [bacterium]|nr:hypothetical protein [bacterium]